VEDAPGASVSLLLISIMFLFLSTFLFFSSGTYPVPTLESAISTRTSDSHPQPFSGTGRVSCSTRWPQTHDLPSLPPECWDNRHVPPCLSSWFFLIRNVNERPRCEYQVWSYLLVESVSTTFQQTELGHVHIYTHTRTHIYTDVYTHKPASFKNKT
jgi:hypothetical protein